LVNYIRTFSKIKKVQQSPQPPVKVETNEEKALRIEKENNQNFEDLKIKADTLMAQKKYVEAKVVYQNALQLKPNDTY